MPIIDQSDPGSPTPTPTPRPVAAIFRDKRSQLLSLANTWETDNDGNLDEPITVQNLVDATRLIAEIFECEEIGELQSVT